MDHEIDKQKPSSAEGGQVKVGDKVWVKATVAHNSDSSEYMELDHNGYEIIAHKSDCRPVELEASKKINTVTFDIGDPVMSYDGRKGIVEAINLIEGFPITVRYSMREQVSYKFGDVKHDDDPMGKEDVKQSLKTESDPINPLHYKQGPIECIEAIKAALVDGFPDYLRGNVIKYLWRYKEKNGIEDLRKSAWYLDRLIEEVGE